jgi:hypothetical protein
VPGIEIFNMLSSKRFDGSLTENVVITDDSNFLGIKHTWGETIHFRNVEFIADRFDNLSLSPEGNDSGTIFMGMAHSGSPSLYDILQESTGEVDSASSKGGSSSFPISQGCNVVTPIIPIATTLPSEGTPAPLTIPMVPLRTAVPQPYTRLLREWLWAYQEEQQCVLQADTERMAAK